MPDRCIACRSVIRNRGYKFCDKHAVCPRCYNIPAGKLSEKIQCPKCKKWLANFSETVVRRLLKKHKGNRRAVMACLNSLAPSKFDEELEYEEMYNELFGSED